MNSKHRNVFVGLLFVLLLSNHAAAAITRAQLANTNTNLTTVLLFTTTGGVKAYADNVNPNPNIKLRVYSNASGELQGKWVGLAYRSGSSVRVISDGPTSGETLLEPLGNESTNGTHWYADTLDAFAPHDSKAVYPGILYALLSSSMHNETMDNSTLYTSHPSDVFVQLNPEQDGWLFGWDGNGYWLNGSDPMMDYHDGENQAYGSYITYLNATPVRVNVTVLRAASNSSILTIGGVNYTTLNEIEVDRNFLVVGIVAPNGTVLDSNVTSLAASYTGGWDDDSNDNDDALSLSMGGFSGRVYVYVNGIKEAEIAACPAGTSLCVDNTCSENCSTHGGNNCSNMTCYDGSVCDPVSQLCVCPLGTSRCVDGSCSANCTQTDTAFNCSNMTCYDGSVCDPVSQLCVCPLGTSRCVDGTCSINCSSTDTASNCTNSTCPTGSVCDVTRDVCVCPVGTSKCIDGTCSINCSSTDTGPDCNSSLCYDNSSCSPITNVCACPLGTSLCLSRICSNNCTRDDIDFNCSSVTCFSGSVCDPITHLCVCPVGTSRCTDGTCSSNCTQTDGNYNCTNNTCIWGSSCIPNLCRCPVGTARCGDGTCSADCMRLNVTLLLPASGSNDTDGNVTFVYNVTSDYSVANCSLYTNISSVWGLNQTDTSVEVNQTNNFTLNNIPDNRVFIWNVVCFDVNGNSATGVANFTLRINIPEPPIAVITPTNPRIVANTNTQFNGSSSYDPDPGDSIASYSWTFGDSGTANTAAPIHNYTSIGVYQVNLTVTDMTSRTGKNTTTAYVCYEVSAGNCIPIANATANNAKTITTHAGTPVNLSGFNSRDIDGGIINYEWNDTLDGAIIYTGTEANISYQFNSTGVHLMLLTVMDTVGATKTDNLTINLTNTPPIANATVNNAKSAVENTTQNLQFNASTSYDPDGDTLTYYWNFGDGTNNTSVAPTHAYTSPGRYNITLNVTDPFNASSKDSVMVTICLNGNCPPKAVAYVNVSQKSVTIHLGTLVNLTGTDSTDLNGKSDIVRYNWSDSNSDILPQQENITNFLFTYCGLHIVTLNVTDAGGLSDTDGVNVTVTNTAPLANGTANGNTTVVVNVSENVLFNASASYDPDGDTLTYFWNFDDGTNSTSILVTHNYSAMGTYEVTLTVRDGSLNGSFANSTTLTVFVCLGTNCPPRAVAGSDIIVLVNHTVYFNASESMDPDGYIVNYTWYFPDTTEYVNGSYINHTFLGTGIFNITLNVTDNSSISDADVVQVIVTTVGVLAFVDGNPVSTLQSAGRPHNLTVLTQYNPIPGYSGDNLSNAMVQFIECNGINTFVLPQYTDSNVTNYAIAETRTSSSGSANFVVTPTGGEGINEARIGNYTLQLRIFVSGDNMPAYVQNFTLSNRHLQNPPTGAYVAIPNRGDISFFTLEVAKVYDKIRRWFPMGSSTSGENHEFTLYTNGSGSLPNITSGKPTGLKITVKTPGEVSVGNATVRVTEKNGYMIFALPQYTNSNVTSYAMAEARTNSNGYVGFTIIPTGASGITGHENFIGNYSVTLSVVYEGSTVYSRNMSVDRSLPAPLPSDARVQTPNKDDLDNFIDDVIRSYDKMKRWIG